MKAVRADELYDQDFFAWTRSQARELRRFARTRPNVALDVEYIAEEIADLGTERRDALRSWTARVIEHLLLLEHSPAKQPRDGWIDEIVNFRSEIGRRLSRTLERDLKRRLPLLYDEARRNLQRKLERHGEAKIAVRLPRALPFHTRPSPRRLLAAISLTAKPRRPEARAPARAPCAEPLLEQDLIARPVRAGGAADRPSPAVTPPSVARRRAARPAT